MATHLENIFAKTGRGPVSASRSGPRNWGSCEPGVVQASSAATNPIAGIDAKVVTKAASRERTMAALIAAGVDEHVLRGGQRDTTTIANSS